MAAVSVNVETQARLADYQSRVADCMEDVIHMRDRYRQLLQEYDVAMQKLEHESKLIVDLDGEIVDIDSLPHHHPLWDTSSDIADIKWRIDSTLRWCGLYQDTAQQLTHQKNMEQQYNEERDFEERDPKQL
jgi:hypothetical protein